MFYKPLSIKNYQNSCFITCLYSAFKSLIIIKLDKGTQTFLLDDYKYLRKGTQLAWKGKLFKLGSTLVFSQTDTIKSAAPSFKNSYKVILVDYKPTCPSGL